MHKDDHRGAAAVFYRYCRLYQNTFIIYAFVHLVKSLAHFLMIIDKQQGMERDRRCVNKREIIDNTVKY